MPFSSKASLTLWLSNEYGWWYNCIASDQRPKYCPKSCSIKTIKNTISNPNLNCHIIKKIRQILITFQETKKYLKPTKNKSNTLKHQLNIKSKVLNQNSRGVETEQGIIASICKQIKEKTCKYLHNKSREDFREQELNQSKTLSWFLELRGGDSFKSFVLFFLISRLLMKKGRDRSTVQLRFPLN